MCAVQLTDIPFIDMAHMVVGGGTDHAKKVQEKRDKFASETPLGGVIVGGVELTGYAAGLMLGGGYALGNRVIDPLARMGTKKLGRGILRIDLFLMRDMAKLRKNPAQEVYITHDRTVKLNELFENRYKLTVRGEQIKSEIIKGNVGELRKWFDDQWVRGDKSGKTKEAPKKKGEDVAYDVWLEKVIELFYDLAKPFAEEMYMSEGLDFKYPRTDKRVDGEFRAAPGAVPVSVELIPGGAPLVFDFSPANFDPGTFAAKIALQPPPYTPASFREHMAIVFDEWFRQVIDDAGVAIPQSVHDEYGRAFIQARESAFWKFRQIVDPAPSELTDLEETLFGKMNRPDVSRGTMEHLFEDYLNRRDSTTKARIRALGSIKLPIELAPHASGLAADEIDLDFTSVGTDATSLAKAMGLDSGNYSFKALSTNVFKGWYDKQWAVLNPTNPAAAVPYPGMANYSSYITGFRYAYLVFMRKLEGALLASGVTQDQFNLIKDNEQKLMGENAVFEAKGEKFDVPAMRMLPANMRTVLKGLNDISKKAATIPVWEALGFPANTQITEANWHSFSDQWGKIYFQYQTRQREINDLKTALGAVYPPTNDNYKQAIKIIDAVQAKINQELPRALQTGLVGYIDRHRASPPLWTSVEKATAIAAIDVLVNPSKSKPEKVTAFKDFAPIFIKDTSGTKFTDYTTGLTVSMLPSFADLMNVREAVDDWQRDMDTIITSQIFIVRSANIDSIPNRRTLVTHLTSIQTALEALADTADHVDLDHLLPVNQNVSTHRQTVFTTLPTLATLHAAYPTTANLVTFNTQINNLKNSADAIKQWGGAVPIGVNIEELEKTHAMLDKLVNAANFGADVTTEADNNMAQIRNTINTEVINRVIYPHPPIAIIPNAQIDPAEQPVVNAMKRITNIRAASLHIARGEVTSPRITDLRTMISSFMNAINATMRARGIDLRKADPAFIAAIYAISVGATSVTYPSILAATILAQE